MTRDIKAWVPLSAIMANQLTASERYNARAYQAGRMVIDKRRIDTTPSATPGVTLGGQWLAMKELSRQHLSGIGKFANYVSLLDHFKQSFGAKVEYQFRQNGPPHKPVFESECFFQQGLGRICVNMFGGTKADSKDLSACRAVMEIAKYWECEELSRYVSKDSTPVESVDGVTGKSITI